MLKELVEKLLGLFFKQEKTSHLLINLPVLVAFLWVGHTLWDARLNQISPLKFILLLAIPIIVGGVVIFCVWKYALRRIQEAYILMWRESYEDATQRCVMACHALEAVKFYPFSKRRNIILRQCFFRHGIIMLILDRDDEAKDCFRKAQSILHDESPLKSDGWLTYARGICAARKGEKDKARILYEESLAVFGGEKDKLGEGYALVAISQLALSLDKDQDADKYFRESYQCFVVASNNPGVNRADAYAGAVCVLAGLGVIANRLGKLVEAENYFKEGLKYSKQIRDSLGEASLLLGLGDVELARGNYKASREHYNAALGRYQKSGSRLGEADVMIGLGELARMTSDNKLAESYYEKALHLYQDLKSPFGEARALYFMGSVVWILGKPEEARSRFSQADMKYKEIGSCLGEADVNRELGEIERRCGNINLAREHLEHALNLYIKCGIPLGVANTRVSLGDMALGQKNFKESRKHFDAALSLYKTGGHRTGEAYAMRGQGDLERISGRHDAARVLYEEARMICQAVEARHTESDILLGHGDLKRQNREDDAAAEHFYREALGKYQMMGCKYGVADAFLRLGKLDLARDRKQEASESLHQAQIIYQKMGFSPESGEVEELIRHAASSVGD